MKGVCTTGCSHLLSALRTPFTASSKVSLLATHALSFYWKLSLFDFICESFAERKITLIVFLFNTPTMSYPSSRLRCFWEVRYRSWWDSFTCEESLLSCCFQILPFAFVSTSFLRCVSLWASVCFLLAVHWALEMQTDFHQTWGVVSSHSFFWYYFVVLSVELEYLLIKLFLIFYPFWCYCKWACFLYFSFRVFIDGV